MSATPSIDELLRQAVVHHQAGRLGDAEECYRRILARDPDHPDALHLLGLVAQASGRPDLSETLVRRAMVLRPGIAIFHNSLAVALDAQGKKPDAIAQWSRAVELEPTYVAPRLCLAREMHDAGDLDAAAGHLHAVLQHHPNHPVAHNDLGIVLQQLGLAAGAREHFAAALKLDPAFVTALSNLLLALHFDRGDQGMELLQEHLRWARAFADPLKKDWAPHPNDRSEQRVLRVGYVSADFCHHPVGLFMAPLLEHHDRARVHITCFHNGTRTDALTARLMDLADDWQEVHALGDGAMAHLIRQQRIDVLVDLSGHTAGNRLLVFARRPAPVQVSYLGYPSGTGMQAIDWRLVDGITDPPGLTDRFQVEQLWRIAGPLWAWRPEPAPLPEPAPGRALTFGSFNNLAKVTEPMVRTWGRILRQVTGSHLLLKARGLSSAAARQRITGLLRDEGIEPDRFELRQHERAYATHLLAYGQIDVALDTYPYCGTTTTCEALWMGVPVVTLAGPTHVSRVGASLLSAAGLQSMIAESTDDYVQVATSLATDRPDRRAVRQALEQSPVGDAARLARQLEHAYREMWLTWLRGRVVAPENPQT